MNNFVLAFSHFLSFTNLVFFVPAFVFFMLAFIAGFGVSLLYKLIILPKIIIKYLNKFPNAKYTLCLKKHPIHMLVIMLFLDICSFFIIGQGLIQKFLVSYLNLALMYLLSGGGLLVSYIVVMFMINKTRQKVS